MRNLSFRIIAGCLLLAFTVLLPPAILSMMDHRPDNLGLVDGKLRSCGDRQNCVCTEDNQSDLSPISFQGLTAQEAMAALRQVISQMPRTKVVTQRDDYLHAEFTSLIFRFTDDAEFRIDEDAAVIQCRSASRVGYSDLGANQARITKISAEFQKLQQTQDP